LDTIERPSEIMILIIMEILGGVFSLVEGLLNITTFGSMTPINGGSSTLIIIGKSLGVILVLTAIVSFLIVYGLQKRFIWAWIVARYLSIFNLVFGIFSFPASLFSMIIDLLIIYYLSRPQVKDYFGRS